MAAARAVDPAVASAARVIATVYEDSLDAHWALEAANATELYDGRAFCGKHLRCLTLQHNVATLRARSPILELEEAGLGVHVTLLARAERAGALDNALRAMPLCATASVAARTPSCNAALCIALGPVGAQRAFVPVCASDADDARTDGWRRFEAPIDASRPQVLVLATGLFKFAAGTALLIDDVRILALHAPQRVHAPFFEGPAPFGATWAAMAGATPLPNSKQRSGAGWCQYMSSDFRHGSRQSARDAPRCKMDGDHLRGRWVQNCDPAAADHLRSRPDVYAYGRPMPRVAGKGDRKSVV